VRYGIHLLPDAFLLVALLRMTFVGLAAQRRAMFFFLAAWLAYSVAQLFLAQVFPTSSHEYALAFFYSTIAIWATSLPALYFASLHLGSLHRAIALALLAISLAGVRLVMLTAGFTPVAKILAVNCWVAAATGAIFLFASAGAQNPDLILWRGAGAFFAFYGFGYLLIGCLRLNGWAYAAFVLSGAFAWAALAWFIGPTPDHLFNLEKLGIILPLRTVAAFIERRRDD